jgi:hypothetical protein
MVGWNTLYIVRKFLQIRNQFFGIAGVNLNFWDHENSQRWPVPRIRSRSSTEADANASQWWKWFAKSLAIFSPIDGIPSPLMNRQSFVFLLCSIFESRRFTDLSPKFSQRYKSAGVFIRPISTNLRTTASPKLPISMAVLETGLGGTVCIWAAPIHLRG